MCEPCPEMEVDGVDVGNEDAMVEPAATVQLLFIAMENFKSCEGRIVVGPFLKTTLIIGAPASGKSNLMDAIGFVLGERTSRLRAKDLSDLIYGAHVGRPVSGSASVTAVFRKADGALARFTRLVVGSSSEYRVDDRAVDDLVYREALENIGVNVKANNLFLAFHGAVRSIADMNPKERSALFEDISGSGELKEEYDRLKTDWIRAKEDAQFCLQKKRGFGAEKKQAVAEKIDASAYKKLNKNLAKLRIQASLFEIYRCEEDVALFNEDLRRKNFYAENAGETVKQVEEELAESRRERDRESLAEVEEETEEAERDITEKEARDLKSRTSTAYVHKRLETAKKFVRMAELENNLRSEETQRLETELIRANVAAQAYERSHGEALRSRARDIVLTDPQIAAYDRLKEEATAASTRYEADLHAAMRNKDGLEDELHKELSEERLLKLKEAQLEEAEKRRKIVGEQIKRDAISLKELKDRESKMADPKERIEEIEARLEDVTKELLVESRRRRKAEAVKAFKELLSGVHGRVADLCFPTETRYEAAVASVLADKMDCIAVDTVETARACGRPFQDAENFIALDFVATKPPSKRLRNTDRFSDVVRFEPAAVKSAVLSAAVDVAVCETPEDTNRVACKYGDGRRHAAVSLDGTYYRKSGIVSRGTADLGNLSTDETRCLDLEKEKLLLTEELRSLEKKKREMVREQSTLRTRMKRVESAMERAQSDESNILARIDNLKREIGEATPHRVKDAEANVKKAESEVADIRKKMEAAEDEVFSAFCREIGVDNIRQYEECEMLELPKLVKQKLKLDEQILNLEKQLEYEWPENTAANLQKCRDEVEELEQELEQRRLVENRNNEELDIAKKRLENAEKNLVAKRMQIVTCQHKVTEVHKKMLSVAKEMRDAKKLATAVESEIESKNAERQRLLLACKTDDIRIPLLRGTLEHWDPEGPVEVDFSGLTPEMQEALGEDEIGLIADALHEEMRDAELRVALLEAPNVFAGHRFREAHGRYVVAAVDCELASEEARHAETAFKHVRKERRERFRGFLNYAVDNVNGVYKRLMRDQGAEAYLAADDPEEPYLGGVKYGCAMPGKRLRPMSGSSGSEKTMAALALIFAIHSFKPAPFFVLDDIGQWLDQANTQRFASFIGDSSSHAFQRIVISSEEEFFEHVDAVIALNPSASDPTGRVLSLDMRQYLA